jgi:hypothetical protein
MMKYCVVEERDIDKLEEKVALLLSRGWKPQGGINAVILAPIMNIKYYQQAMVKEE